MTTRDGGLGSGFIRAAQQFPGRPALEIDGKATTYEELYQQAAALAATLLRHAPSEGPPLTAVLGHRSTTAFAGVLAALFRGHGYVPLNPSFPAERTQTMLGLSGCRSLIVEAEAEKSLDQILEGIDRELILIFPNRSDVSALATRFPRHKVLGSREIAPEQSFRPLVPPAKAVAYLLFTSGSTGVPKGVMVSHRSVARFLRVMQERYSLDETDRLSQMFDLVFDLSIFDMFMAWEVGACVCCPSRRQILMPTDYIQASGITVWFSVPSAALLLQRLGLLEPGIFPGLRLSLFCGEALPAAVARAWQEAAPASLLENLYGPTELTLACALYRWSGPESHDECENGIVPIGAPFPGMTAMVVDDRLKEVAPGQAGELLMSGPQVALGYWDDPVKTRELFITPPGRDQVFYRTGDLVRRSPLGSHPLLFLGRVDHQIKIHGSRVELGEIEAVLREASGAERVVALGWPIGPSGIEGIAAFLEARAADLDAVVRAARSRLPSYMIPRELRLVPTLPLTSNGKIDRKALIALLDNPEPDPDDPGL